MTKVNSISRQCLREIGVAIRSEARKRGIVMAAYMNQKKGFTLWGEPTTLNGIANLVYVANQERN